MYFCVGGLWLCRIPFPRGFYFSGEINVLSNHGGRGSFKISCRMGAVQKLKVLKHAVGLDYPWVRTMWSRKPAVGV
jgi:hypothetical protein